MPQRQILGGIFAFASLNARSHSPPPCQEFRGTGEAKHSLAIPTSSFQMLPSSCLMLI
ncbi:hypothetical protein NC652_015010 [Populus alba x Populus x berolinensis]|nr:hypothetical protein NC652_015010 [Populus alba x Populus x berolinensis]